MRQGERDDREREQRQVEAAASRLLRSNKNMSRGEAIDLAKAQRRDQRGRAMDRAISTMFYRGDTDNADSN